MCVQLEWNMKLWWPHCEALISYLMAYSHIREPKLLDRFKLIYDYTFRHVRHALETCNKLYNGCKVSDVSIVVFAQVF